MRLLQIAIFIPALLRAGAPQVIAFSPISDRILGISPFSVSAKTSSGLPVSFTAGTASVCRIASGLISLLGPGACSIMASQTGNSSFSAATPVVRTFMVNPARLSGSLMAAPGSPFSLGANPYSVIAGDFNGDGIDDLVTANGAANSLTVLLGNGAGGFSVAPGSPFVAGPGPVSLAVGDFNGDGFDDLAVGNTVLAGGSVPAGAVTVLLGNGLGGFTAAAGSPFSAGSYAIPQSIAAGDFNGDGIPDLAVADRGNNTVIILLGDGQGGFAQSPASPLTLGSAPTGPACIAVGDFNGDGMQDLATANQVGGTVNVLLGNGAGGFTTAPGGVLRVGAQPLSLALGDFNGDGFQDIATANNAGNSVSVLLGNGTGAFSAAAGSPFPVTSPWSVSVGDMNGDAKPDLAVASAGNGVTLLLGDGAGGFSPIAGSPFAGGTNPISLAVADFDQDGIEDLAAASYDARNVAVLLGGLASTISVLGTSSPSTVPFGQAVHLTLTVSDAGGAFSAPTGTATFMSGGKVLGMASQTSSPYTFTAVALGGGGNALTALYAGDIRSLGSASNAINIQVTGAPPATISALNPGGAAPGGAGFLLTITGTGFVQASQVQWNMLSLPANYISATQLTVMVPPILIATAGSQSIAVINPGATASNTVSFAVAPLTVTSLSPASAIAMGAAFTLCANGTGFYAGSTLQWNGAALPITSVTATQACATVSSALIGALARVSITVANPDGTTSAAIAFSVNAPPAPPPTISAGGIVPIYSSSPVIEAGSWVSIFGTNLASDTFTWKGDFPTTLGGVSVTIDKKPAYLWSVSPTQINLQAPDDASTGKVSVVVTTPSGTVNSSVTLAQYSPSFSLFPGSHFAAGVIVTPQGSGAYGGGTYDLLGPAARFDFNTRPVKAGETLTLYGVGFGPTMPPVPAGRVFGGSAQTAGSVKVTIGGLPANVVFAGMTQTGLYQINVVVPGTGSGDQALKATVGTAATPGNVFVTVQ